jgi:integrase
MARPATGSVLERPGKTDVSFAIRFRAYGKREQITLGTKGEGWTRAKAEDALADTLADVRRGIWHPRKPEPVEPPSKAPTFLEFSNQWFASRLPELRERTIEDYKWSLELHLLPFFADLPLAEITVERVDAYKAWKLGQGKLAAAQINKTLKRLAQILDLAVDYGHLPSNPAASKGGRRRVKETPPVRTWVQPEQLLTLLACAPKGHRPILATMAGAGLRVGEACALDWRDLDLAAGTLTVQESKTPTGRREVELPPALVTELWTLAATGEHTEPGDPVFVGTQGSRQTPANVSRRVKTALAKANPKLEAASIAPMSERVSPHSLRRTFASLRFALGDDPVYVAEQGGWTDPAYPLRYYARAVRRRGRLSGAALAAFDAALDWARAGTNAGTEESPGATNGDARRQESAPRAEK